MSTDKTLADVQPGGRVRLGDQVLSTSEGARRYVADFFATQLRRHDFGDYILTELAADFACALAQHLSAQPSPGGQGVDPGRVAVEFIAAANFDVPDGYVVEEHLPGIWHYTYTNAGEKMASCASWNNKAHATIAAWQAVLAARQPVGEPIGYLIDSDNPEIGRYFNEYPTTRAERCRPIYDGNGEVYAAPPAQAVSQDWHHIANEWADAATNGVQWLRNIRDGASTVADALACMESNVERIRQMKPKPVGEPVAVRVTPEMRAAFRKAYREGGFWADRLDTALDAMMRAAPPAQAVDLERFRGTVKSQYSMTEWMHRCGFVSAEKLEESKKNHDHLMALIDSQAVGNG